MKHFEGRVCIKYASNLKKKVREILCYNNIVIKNLKLIFKSFSYIILK